MTGVGFLVSIRAADSFGLGPTARGLLLAGFGFSGVIAGRPAGNLVDRRGRVAHHDRGRAGLRGDRAAARDRADAPGWMAAAWLAAGVGSALIWAGLNTLTVRAAPANRAGAVSFIGAWKFAGNAAGPAVWLPLYHVREWLAFALAGAASALIGGCARAADRPDG